MIVLAAWLAFTSGFAEERPKELPALRTWEHYPTIGHVVPLANGREAVSYTGTMLILWDLAGKTPPKGWSVEINSIAEMPGSSSVLLVADDKWRLWDPAREAKPAEAVPSIELKHSRVAGRAAGVGWAAVSPDGKRTLAITGPTAEVTTLEGVSLIKLKDEKVSGSSGANLAHEREIRGAEWTPDGRRLVTASRDKLLKLWDAKSGKLIRVFEGHKASIHCVAVSPDGNKALAGDEQGGLKLWVLSTGKSVDWPGHRYAVETAVFSPDGSYAVTGGSDDRIRVWDTASGRQLDAWYAHTEQDVNELAFLPDGKTVLSVGSDTRMKTWDMEAVVRLARGAGSK
ncbi:MAG: hypothetical protein HY925_09710 [Elusimicrobia bacterium]|nr:hypothetical protein [Elusimicrobiota bacterium]